MLQNTLRTIIRSSGCASGGFLSHDNELVYEQKTKRRKGDLREGGTVMRGSNIVARAVSLADCRDRNTPPHIRMKVPQYLSLGR